MSDFNLDKLFNFDCEIIIGQLASSQNQINDLLQLDSGNFNTILDTDERKLAYFAIENELNRYQVNKDILKNLKVERISDVSKNGFKEWKITYNHNAPIDSVALLSIACLFNCVSMSVTAKCRFTGLRQRFTFCYTDLSH